MRLIARAPHMQCCAVPVRQLQSREAHLRGAAALATVTAVLWRQGGAPTGSYPVGATLGRLPAGHCVEGGSSQGLRRAPIPRCCQAHKFTRAHLDNQLLFCCSLHRRPPDWRCPQPRPRLRPCPDLQLLLVRLEGGWGATPVRWVEGWVGGSGW